MTRNKARDIDDAVYVEQEDGNWYVFGNQTGFAYYGYATEIEAKKVAGAMNSEFSAMTKMKSVDFPKQIP